MNNLTSGYDVLISSAPDERGPFGVKPLWRSAGDGRHRNITRIGIIASRGERWN